VPTSLQYIRTYKCFVATNTVSRKFHFQPIKSQLAQKNSISNVRIHLFHGLKKNDSPSPAQRKSASQATHTTLLARKASPRTISWLKRFRRKSKCETTLRRDWSAFRFDDRSSRSTLVSLGSIFTSPKPSVSCTLLKPRRHCYAVSGHTNQRRSGERSTAVQASQNLSTAFRIICDLAPSTACAVR